MIEQVRGEASERRLGTTDEMPTSDETMGRPRAISLPWVQVVIVLSVVIAFPFAVWQLLGGLASLVAWLTLIPLFVAWLGAALAALAQWMWTRREWENRTTAGESSAADG